MVEALLMARYHQSYSELQNIPFRKIIFFVRLAEAEDAYTKQKMEQYRMRKK